MGRRSATPIRRVSIDRMNQSLERTLRAEGRSEKTIYSYTLSVRLLSEFLAARGRDLTVDVSRDDLRDFITEQATPRKVIDSLGRIHRGGSPATALVRYFKREVNEEELDISPMVGMHARSFEREAPPIVDDDVLTKLLKVRTGTGLSDRRDAALLRTFIDTGCWLAEVTGLRQGDVDVASPRDRGARQGQPGTRGGAGQQGDIGHLQVPAQTRARMARACRRRFPLWYGRAGRMSTYGVAAVMHRMCANAEVPRLHWHQLRHTAAHVWLAPGAGEGDLMQDMGWPRSMLDVYARANQAERAREIGATVGSWRQSLTSTASRTSAIEWRRFTNSALANTAGDWDPKRIPNPEVQFAIYENVVDSLAWLRSSSDHDDRTRRVSIFLVALLSVATLTGCSPSSSAATRGNTVGVVGDSITFLSTPSIERDLRGWHYNIQALKGMTIASMTPVMEKRIIKGPHGPPHGIVINLGTNDVISGSAHWRSDWQRLMADTANVPREVLFTISDIVNSYIKRPGGPTAQDINRIIFEAHLAYPSRVHVIDWNAEVEATGSVIRFDGVHPNTLGQQWIGAHISRTLNQNCRS